MMAVIDVMLKGGRIAGHDVSFHGGVVEDELKRLKMSALRHVWKMMMSSAVCLMNPDIGRWLRETSGQDPGATSASNALSLCELGRLLLPEPPGGHRSVGQGAAMLGGAGQVWLR